MGSCFSYLDDKYNQHKCNSSQHCNDTCHSTTCYDNKDKWYYPISYHPYSGYSTIPPKCNEFYNYQNPPPYNPEYRK